MKHELLIAALTGVLLVSCGTGQPVDEGDGTACEGGKCDTPNNDPYFDVAEVCRERQREIFDGNRDLFLGDALRWSCADVRGVNTNNKDSRGQEYCEYWAGIRLPDEAAPGGYAEPVTLGRHLSEDEGDVTPLSLELSDEQIFYLEDNADSVVGSCYFVSWHGDYEEPLPACQYADECASTRDGLALDADTFRMKLFFNSNEAANLLVNDCVSGVLSENYQQGDVSDPDDPLHSDYLRGCHLADAFGLAWRKSDSTVCSAAMRLTECGCLTDATAAAMAIVPPPTDPNTPRGFPLGGWASLETLPAGCSYVETGDDSRTIVQCDLNGGDVLAGQTDLKGYCQSRYAANVVVYVPLPVDALTCAPGSGQYAETCTETPWMVTR